MLLFVFCLATSFSPSWASFRPDQSVKFNFPVDRARMTLYDEPGFDYLECKAQNNQNCQTHAKAWPDNQSTVRLVQKKGQIQKRTVQLENYYGETESRTYYQVEVDYGVRGSDGITRYNTSRVWVEEKYLIDESQPSDAESERALAILEGRLDPTKKENCPESGVQRPSSRSETRNNLPIQALARNLESTQNSRESQIANLISPHIGHCGFSPPLTQNPGWDLNSTIYDQAVLPKLNANALPQAQLEQLAGRRVTREDLINIDVLARTIYAEMGSCFDNGIEYPMAIAKVALNRADFLEQNGFSSCWANGRNFQDPFNVSTTNGGRSRPTLSRVLTADNQFSVWNPRIGGQFNKSGLQQALCPPASHQNYYWKATAAGARVQTPAFEREIWNKTIQIAVEAVLFPERFRERTAGVPDFFYTSGILKQSSRERVIRQIGNRQLASQSCLNLFRVTPGGRFDVNIKDSSERAKRQCLSKRDTHDKTSAAFYFISWIGLVY